MIFLQNHLASGEQKLFRLLERSDRGFARDRRKSFQVVEEGLDRHAGSTEHRSSAKNILAFRYDAHDAIVPRSSRKPTSEVDLLLMSALLLCAGGGSCSFLAELPSATVLRQRRNEKEYRHVVAIPPSCALPRASGRRCKRRP